MTIKMFFENLTLWQQKGVELGNDISNTYSKQVINRFTANKN